MSLLAALMATMSMAFVQGGDPELQTKRELAEIAAQRGRMLLAGKQFEEAISAFREAVAIADTFGRFDSRYNYELARGLTLAGRSTEALDAYRRAVLWDPDLGDLRTSTAPVEIAIDYAILLAKLGRAEEAKCLYYFALRRLNPTVAGIIEPFPLLVVFDPDVTMSVWEYTPERLTAVGTAIKAQQVARIQQRELLFEARQLEPSWIFPAVCLVWQPPEFPTTQEKLAEASKLAKTEEERVWAGIYQSVFRAEDPLVQQSLWRNVSNEMAAIGAVRRKASKVLEEARLNLKNIHHKIAVTRDP